MYCNFLLIIGCLLHYLAALSQTKKTSVIASPAPIMLWYKQPARQTDSIPYGNGRKIGTWDGGKNGWREALPVGNGHMGAMVFGGVFHERVQLNEETLWGGFPINSNNPQSSIYLPEIQRLMFEGRNEEGKQLAEKYLLGIPKSVKSYQSLGDMFLDMIPSESVQSYSQYARTLSLDSAVATTRFVYQGKTYLREVFASHPAGVIVMRISCSTSASIDTHISLLREQDAQIIGSPDPSLLIMRGQIEAINGQTGQNKGMRFETQVKAIIKGGNVRQENGRMTISKANEVMLFIAASTSYLGKEPATLCRQSLEQMQQESFQTLLAEHVADYQKLYNRVSLKLGESLSPWSMATDERLLQIKKSHQDPYLSALVFQYGRYLTIASSRPGDLPANLQGLWNQHINAPWNSDYHTNINLQMNYWPTELANLAECHQPLFVLMDSLVAPGTQTAKETYKARG